MALRPRQFVLRHIHYLAALAQREAQVKLIRNPHRPKYLSKCRRSERGRLLEVSAWSRVSGRCARSIGPKRQSTKHVRTGRSLSMKSGSSKIWSEASESNGRTARLATCEKTAQLKALRLAREAISEPCSMRGIGQEVRNVEPAPQRGERLRRTPAEPRTVSRKEGGLTRLLIVYAVLPDRRIRAIFHSAEKT